MKVELLSWVSSDGLGTSVGKLLPNLLDELLDGLKSMSLLPGALPAPPVSHPSKVDYTDTTYRLVYLNQYA